MNIPRRLPASFFGIVLGLVGWGGAWRAAARLWSLPTAIGEAVMGLGVLVWAILLVLYAMKWMYARDAALAEVRHAIQCCFIGLVPASTALVGLALAPHAHGAAVAAWLVGSIGQLAFGVWRSAGMWQGGRELASTTPVLYLPIVAGNFIAAIVGGQLGYPSWGLLFAGAGLFSWFALESTILLRLWTGPALAEPLRPVLGIQLAPPVVAAAALLANTEGAPGQLVQLMWGYGLFQALLLLRSLPWIARQPFAASYWAFSFGVTALAGDALQMSLRGVGGAIATLAPWVFAFTNAVMLILTVGSLLRLAQGRLLPPAAGAPIAAPAQPQGA